MDCQAIQNPKFKNRVQVSTRRHGDAFGTVIPVFDFQISLWSQVMSKRAIILFSIVGILIISTAGYLGLSTSTPPTPTPAPQTVAVTTCDVEQSVTAPGNLVNVNQADVQMPATGRISLVNVRVGDPVRAGQSLAELDDVTTSQAQLNL